MGLSWGVHTERYPSHDKRDGEGVELDRDLDQPLNDDD